MVDEPDEQERIDTAPIDLDPDAECKHGTEGAADDPNICSACVWEMPGVQAEIMGDEEQKHRPVNLPIPREALWSVAGALVVFAVSLAAIAWGVWGLMS